MRWIEEGVFGAGRLARTKHPRQCDILYDNSSIESVEEDEYALKRRPRER
jgi:hypothetical protein